MRAQKTQIMEKPNKPHSRVNLDWIPKGLTNPGADFKLCCDSCDGLYSSTGRKRKSLFSNRNEHEHKCDSCGKVDWMAREYE